MSVNDLAVEYPVIPAGLTTPSVILDLAVAQANIDRMQAAADACGVALRPHVKTHKSIEVGRLQVRAGARGITAGTLGEVEVFARAGFDDIFLAYPVWAVGDRAERLRHLLDTIHLRIGIDSPAAATALSALATAQRPVEVVIEVDCGARRCGVAPDAAGALAEFARSVGLRPIGAYTYPGHGDRDAAARQTASDDEVRALALAQVAMTAAGILPTVLSAGSTPTAALSGRPPVTELRPGEYVYNDLGKCWLGACGPADLALFVVTTVVSNAVPGQVIVDVGTKALGREGSEAIGFGRVPSIPAAVLFRLNEYHGYLRIPEDVHRPAIGEQLLVAPNHVCPVVNLFDDVVVHRQGTAEAVWQVDARGHLA